MHEENPHQHEEGRKHMTSGVSRAMAYIADAEKDGYHIPDDEKRFILRYAFYSEDADLEPYIRKTAGIVPMDASSLKAEKERMENEIEMKRQAIAIVIDTIEATEEVLAAVKEALKEGKAFLRKNNLLSQYEEELSRGKVKADYAEKLMEAMRARKEKLEREKQEKEEQEKEEREKEEQEKKEAIILGRN